MVNDMYIYILSAVAAAMRKKIIFKNGIEREKNSSDIPIDMN